MLVIWKRIKLPDFFIIKNHNKHPIHMKKMDKRPFRFSRLNDFSHSAMDWLGSVPSLLVHTFFFLFSFSLILFGIDSNKILLVVTTIVSLEAIYMAIFIQMAVNKNNQSLNEMEADIDEIQEDVEEIQKDVDEIQKDVDEIQEDVDEIQEDVEEISEDEEDETQVEKQNKLMLEKIQSQLQVIMSEIDSIKMKK